MSSSGIKQFPISNDLRVLEKLILHRGVYDDSRALNDVIFHMNVAVKCRHWKFLRYYENIVHQLTQTLKPFVPIFTLKMICKKKKLSLITGIDRNFRLSAEPRYCVNSHPRDRKIPSEPVTSERFL